MDLLEQKLNEMENIQGGADKIAAALAVSSTVCCDNKKHDREKRQKCLRFTRDVSGID